MTAIKYFAVFEKVNEAYNVYFPDFPNSNNSSKTFADALQGAKQCVLDEIINLENQNQALPKATEPPFPNTSNTCIVCEIDLR